MSQPRSPTVRLLAGLAITLSAVALYSGYMVMQLRGLENGCKAASSTAIAPIRCSFCASRTT